MAATACLTSEAEQKSEQEPTGVHLSRPPSQVQCTGAPGRRWHCCLAPQSESRLHCPAGSAAVELTPATAPPTTPSMVQVSTPAVTVRPVTDDLTVTLHEASAAHAPSARHSAPGRRPRLPRRLARTEAPSCSHCRGS
jgi:hypothetical protein